MEYLYNILNNLNQNQGYSYDNLHCIYKYKEGKIYLGNLQAAER